MDKKDKVVATITKDESGELEDIAHLRRAAKRILVDVERDNRAWWKKLKKKYRLKPDDYVLDFDTREIRKTN